LLLAALGASSLPSRVRAAVTLSKDVGGALAQRGLTLDLRQLAHFDNVRVVPNPHVNVQIGARNAGAGLDIRYGWIGLSAGEDEFGASTIFLTAVMNITDPARRRNMIEPKPFPPADVKAEFNADAGWTSLTVPRSTFALAEAALVNGIFSRRHQTLAWMVYLYRPLPGGGMPSGTQAAVVEAFHALRFSS
jgi:hypothetical protein